VNALPEAFPLAVAAAIYPPTLIVLLLLMSGERPRRLTLAFYLGAAVLTVCAGLIALAVVKSLGLTTQHSHTKSGWTYIALGVLLLALAAWAARRRHRQPVVSSDEETASTGRIAEWSHRATTSEKWAFALGLALFLPSPFYLMAIKDIADSGSSNSSNTAAVLVCALGVLILIESALIALLLRPEQVTSMFTRLDAWTRRNGWTLLAVLALIGGFYGIVKGINALT
jgi:MFS family permease